MTAPLARAREGSPYPVARLSVEAAANAFVVLGLLPAARAEEILAAQRPALEAAGFRVGREIGELCINPGAHSFQEARAAVLDSPRQIPLAVAAGPARLPLRRHDLAITWATLTPEGIRLRYRGGARNGDRDVARALVREITEDITELSITDDDGGTYRVPAANVPGGISGQCSASGETRWIPEGELLAVLVPGHDAAVTHPVAGVRRLRPARSGRDLAARHGAYGYDPAALADPGGVLPGPARTTGSRLVGRLLRRQPVRRAPQWDGGLELSHRRSDLVGALPPDSAVLTGVTDRVSPDWHLALSDRQQALMGPWASSGQVKATDLAVRLPLERATAVLESITALEDMVSVQLYGHPWIFEEYWPLIAPCFRVTAVDDTGAEHEGGPGHGTVSAGHEGSGVFWFWPPVGPQARQLRVTVSTLWEAAWALVDIPGR
jgi:hypothetical protein